MVSLNPMRLFSSFWLETWLFWTSKSSDDTISPPADSELLSLTAKNRRGESHGPTHRKPPQSETEARDHIESIVKRRGPDSPNCDDLQAALTV
jgi:hypothetical protein